MKPVLKYPGSKWRLARWIINMMPKHRTYIEPFFGSGAIFFRKKPSAIETINDLDNNVVNLFRCIRKDAARLAKLVAGTPYSRKEHEAAYEKKSTVNNYEQARLFLVRCWQGHGFRATEKVGWKNDVHGRERAYSVYNWYRLPEWITNITERLRQVQIECRPAIEVIQRHKYNDVLIYADPPYLRSTRTAGNHQQYNCEMTEQDHIELLEVLLQHPGPVLLSGYNSELYNQALKRWHTEDQKGYAEHGGCNRTEKLWMNFEPECTQISLLQGE